MYQVVLHPKLPRFSKALQPSLATLLQPPDPEIGNLRSKSTSFSLLQDSRLPPSSSTVPLSWWCTLLQHELNTVFTAAYSLPTRVRHPVSHWADVDAELQPFLTTAAPDVCLQYCHSSFLHISYIHIYTEWLFTEQCSLISKQWIPQSLFIVQTGRCSCQCWCTLN